MPSYSNDPVPHIITFRVNDEEKEILRFLAQKSGRSISNYMRNKVQSIRDNEKLGTK
jgi:predicted DNA-binding protein